jgi:hypothetical protein
MRIYLLFSNNIPPKNSKSSNDKLSESLYKLFCFSRDRVFGKDLFGDCLFLGKDLFGDRFFLG